MMKYLKRFVIVVALCVTCWVLSACNTSTTTTVEQYILPDLTGKTVFNYTDAIDTNKIYVALKTEPHQTIPQNEFIRYGNNLKPGDAVHVGTTVEVYFSSGQEVVDNDPPIITGVEDIEIEWNTPFDPLEGVKAVDKVLDVEVDLTDKIRVILLDKDKNRIDEINTSILTTYYVRYSVTDKANNNTTVERKVTIGPIKEITTPYTDNLKMDFDYEGKTFLVDGVERVQLASCIDGDTADFKVFDPQANDYDTIRVRFQGIDTPESTPLGGYEQWGEDAKDFTCGKLKNAKEIVLEADPNLTKVDTYGRYLAYVWYEGRLLNLEIVEQAYSQFNLTRQAKYYQVFFEAEYRARHTLKRIWGEVDPKCPTCGVKY